MDLKSEYLLLGHGLSSGGSTTLNWPASRGSNSCTCHHYVRSWEFTYLTANLDLVAGLQACFRYYLTDGFRGWNSMELLPCDSVYSALVKADTWHFDQKYRHLNIIQSQKGGYPRIQLNELFTIRVVRLIFEKRRKQGRTLKGRSRDSVPLSRTNYQFRPTHRYIDWQGWPPRLINIPPRL